MDKLLPIVPGCMAIYLPEGKAYKVIDRIVPGEYYARNENTGQLMERLGEGYWRIDAKPIFEDAEWTAVHEKYLMRIDGYDESQDLVEKGKELSK